MKNNQSLAYPLADALAIFDEVVAGLDLARWGKEPAVVRDELLSVAKGDFLPLLAAHQVMLRAETPKMFGGANRGIDHIKQRWKKIRIRLDD